MHTYQITTEREWFKTTSIIPELQRLTMRGMQFHSYVDAIARNMILELEAHIDLTLAEIVKLEVRVPSTWWQHFKEQCFPSWLVKRFPVDYTVKASQELRRYNACPHSPIKCDDFNGNVAHLKFLAGGLNAIRTPTQPQPLQSPGRRSEHRPDDQPGETLGHDFNRID